MKKYIFIFLSIILFYCNSGKQNGKKTSLEFQNLPSPVPEQNSLMVQWEKNPVIETKLVDDMKSGTGWQVNGIEKVSYTNDRANDCIQWLRFQMSLLDEEHYKKRRTGASRANLLVVRDMVLVILKRLIYFKSI